MSDLREAARLEFRLYLPGPEPDPFELDYVIGSQSGNARDVPMPTKEVIIGDGPLLVRIRPTHRGRPAKLDGPVTVAFADESLFSAMVGDDGTSVRFEDRGVVGSTDAVISADVRAGTEVVTRDVTLTLQAVEGDADTLDLEIGEQGADDGTGTPPIGPTPETPA